MYAASASPRESSISVRIASSSRPSCSTSSTLRWVYSLTSEMAIGHSFRLAGFEARPRAASHLNPQGQMSSVQSPTAAVMQVWTGSLGWPYSSPLRRSRTLPATSVSVQVWQMPIRQP